MGLGASRGQKGSAVAFTSLWCSPSGSDAADGTWQIYKYTCASPAELARPLEELEDDSLPRGEGGNAGALGVDVVPVDGASAGVEIDLAGADEEAASLPDVTADPEEENDGGGEVGDEEGLGASNGSAEVLVDADGGESRVELS